MLAHRFDPMQTQRVQHSTGAFHDTEDKDGKHKPSVKDDGHDDRACDAREAKSDLHRHIPQHDRETLMC